MTKHFLKFIFRPEWTRSVKKSSELSEVTRKGVYMTYGYQMKTCDETFLKFLFSIRMDPKCHEVTRKGIYIKYGYQIKAYDETF